jgi:ABC-type uncharacterized transport system ATPase component
MVQNAACCTTCFQEATMGEFSEITIDGEVSNMVSYASQSTKRRSFDTAKL